MSDQLPYRRVENVDVPEYEMCVGPDGFECILTEPEDRTFYRDAKALIDELNRLHAALTAARSEIEQLRVQLAGIFVAVEAGEPPTNAEHATVHAKEGDWGWSPVYQRAREIVAGLRAEIERGKPRLLALERIAASVIERGHHDTCQHVVAGSEFPCVCGYAEASSLPLPTPSEEKKT